MMPKNFGEWVILVGAVTVFGNCYALLDMLPPGVRAAILDRKSVV